MKKHQRLVAILGVNFVVLGVGIVMLELVFGAWLNPSGLNRLNLIKNRSFTYDVSGLYEMGSPVIKYTRDKYGLRGTYGDDPSRIDLLTVGGSTTDQRSVADGLTWQDVLLQQFASNGTLLVMANAGVDGQSTVGHIKNFDWWFPYIPDLKPKYILFYVGLNDFHVEGATDVLLQPSLFSKMKDNSALWHLVRTIRGVFKATRAQIGHQRIDFAALHWTEKPLQNNYDFLAPRLDAFEQRLLILVDKTRSFGSQPVFVTQPSRQYRITNTGIVGHTDVTTYEGHQINGVDYWHIMKQFNNVVEVVCRERHASFIDLAAEPAWEDADFYDFAHMTPPGARKVGIRLFEGLRPIVAAPE
jgi:hypothetical protein